MTSSRERRRSTLRSRLRPRNRGRDAALHGISRSTESLEVVPTALADHDACFGDGLIERLLNEKAEHFRASLVVGGVPYTPRNSINFDISLSDKGRS